MSGLEAWDIPSWPVFIGLTVILTGFCAYMSGEAIAAAWQPLRNVVFSCLLLAGASRFLTYGLFDGELWSLGGYLVDALTLNAIGITAFRLTRARRMVAQYPWLYERSGLFAWRLRPGATDTSPTSAP